jgi:hypothetical protein
MADMDPGLRLVGSGNYAKLSVSPLGSEHSPESQGRPGLRERPPDGPVPGAMNGQGAAKIASHPFSAIEEKENLSWPISS